jgi:hypothetical protein
MESQADRIDVCVGTTDTGFKGVMIAMSPAANIVSNGELRCGRVLTLGQARYVAYMLLGIAQHLESGQGTFSRQGTAGIATGATRLKVRIEKVFSETCKRDRIRDLPLP